MLPVRRPVFGAVVASGLLLALAACSNSGSSNASNSAASSPATGAAAGSGTAGSGTGTGSGTQGASVGGAGAKAVNVTITAAQGCVPDATELAAGGVTFNVTNQDATGVSEIEVLDGQRIVGEKENLAPGLSGNFSITATSGSYVLYCPGAAAEKTNLTVTGEASAPADQDVAALLAEGTKGYAGYVKTQAGYLVNGVAALQAAIKTGDLAKAQAAYAAARPFYEKIEPVAESFLLGTQNLDADIDARAGDVPAAQWRGFHVIEQGLFQKKSVAGLAPVAALLTTNVTKLQTLVATQTYQATDLANGAADLLDEAATGKMTGEEERYSHIDIVDLAANIEGAEQAFAQLRPALDTIVPDLSTQVAGAFTALDSVIDTYRSTDAANGNFVLFSKLSSADTKALAAGIAAVQEPLSQVGAKVASAS